MVNFNQNNKQIYTLMWLPAEDEIIFRAKDESPVAANDSLYSHLKKHIHLHQWKVRYTAAYRQWLDNDNNAIYDISNEINKSMIAALIKLNEDLETKAVFFWFDIDRSVTDEFTWKCCPVSGKKLITLGKEYTKKNAFVSPDYPLIFPDYVSL
ncbi:hypothetical protein [Chitinophaga sp. Cy-1792]|uniref:hypothetical protein n=1 Tax=Chitinophaga sp. Cy-1792 TaxID=2608339 RepID=UPI0014212766|nr:hypothetical protein [Chitinophaga sp. Cy-1792]NIG53543.1 hypothetical protein [Chitinophaga sp. Cy-1792]